MRSVYARAFFDENLDRHVRIESAKKCFGDGQTGHMDGIPRIHHACKACIGRDYAFAGHIASTTRQARTEILGKGVVHESGEGEAL